MVRKRSAPPIRTKPQTCTIRFVDVAPAGEAGTPHAASPTPPGQTPYDACVRQFLQSIALQLPLPVPALPHRSRLTIGSLWSAREVRSPQVPAAGNAPIK